MQHRAQGPPDVVGEMKDYFVYLCRCQFTVLQGAVELQFSHIAPTERGNDSGYE